MQRFGNLAARLVDAMPNHDCQRITAEQAQIEAILREIELAASAGMPGDLRPLGRNRRRLIETMPTHLHHLETEIYPDLLQRCPAADRAEIEALRAEGRAFALAYRLYLARWNAGALLGDWDNYRRAALVMIGRARAHFARFGAQAVPLLECGATDARAA